YRSRRDIPPERISHLSPSVSHAPFGPGVVTKPPGRVRPFGPGRPYDNAGRPNPPRPAFLAPPDGHDATSPAECDSAVHRDRTYTRPRGRQTIVEHRGRIGPRGDRAG